LFAKQTALNRGGFRILNFPLMEELLTAQQVVLKTTIQGNTWGIDTSFFRLWDKDQGNRDGL
jgi:hypothetical protein